MTEESELPIYPQYCFHLSPSINKWCPLQSRDIQALRLHSAFAGQDLFFHLNHPIKWVRIAGVVVAIDEYGSRRVYTVDDSSGINMECLVVVPSVKPPDANTKADIAALAVVPAPAEIPGVPPGLDVGHVVLVKGALSIFRDQKQIKVDQIVLLRSTDEEVKFWEKIKQFRTVLSEPWYLDRKSVRGCRREAEGSFDDDRNAKKRKRTALEARDAKANATREKGPTGLKKRVKTTTDRVPRRGKYDALGL